MRNYLSKRHPFKTPILHTGCMSIICVVHTPTQNLLRETAAWTQTNTNRSGRNSNAKYQIIQTSNIYFKCSSMIHYFIGRLLLPSPFLSILPNTFVTLTFLCFNLINILFWLLHYNPIDPISSSFNACHHADCQ